ncbi:MAG: 4'-phosphopantetheinyl transferase superfamily protein, partial [Lachnospiraceae bacterium]
EDQFLKRNSYKDFFSVWAAKESYVKFTGQGIWDGLASFSVIDENGIVEKIADAQLRFLPFLSDYTLCLCSTEIDEISFVQLD